MNLEQALADWREKANTLRVTKAHITADTLDQCLGDIEVAAERHIRWLSETDAHLYSGRSLRWLRSRFAGWQDQGQAKRLHGKRYYLMGVLPVKPNVEALLAQAERDAKEDAAA